MYNYKRNHKGFTLTEIMVVVAIITLILGIAVPNFLRMKSNASEGAVIKALRTLNTAFEEFWQDQLPHRYPTSLSELDSIPAIQGSPEYADSRLTSGNSYEGYQFGVSTPNNYAYTITATPVNPAVSGSTIYSISQSAEIVITQGGGEEAGSGVEKGPGTNDGGPGEPHF